MSTSRMKKMMPYLIRGFFLLLLLPGNILLCRMACQKLQKHYHADFFGDDPVFSRQAFFAAELANGVKFAAQYGDMTQLDARMDDILVTLHGGSWLPCVCRTNLDGTWFQDMFRPPSVVIYHDTAYMDHDGDFRFDEIHDPVNGPRIRLNGAWRKCRSIEEHRKAVLSDGGAYIWNGTDWIERKGGVSDVGENQTDR